MSNIIYNYHYTYLITNTTNQMKYIGVRSCNCLPENDSNYMGSSKLLNEAMETSPEAFVKTIIETFPTREVANADEQRLHDKKLRDQELEERMLFRLCPDLPLPCSCNVH